MGEKGGVLPCCASLEVDCWGSVVGVEDGSGGGGCVAEGGSVFGVAGAMGWLSDVSILQSVSRECGVGT